MDTQRLYLKVCEQCGCQFESHFAVTRYCSARCANLSKKHKLRDEQLQNHGDEVREFIIIFITLHNCFKLL